MLNKDFNRLINKYAIIILIGYAFKFLTLTISRLLTSEMGYSPRGLFVQIATFSWVLMLILNIIVAISLAKEMKKYDIKNKMIIVMSIFFSLVGVTMFFISANREMKEVKE
jgi:hypothetical protein